MKRISTNPHIRDKSIVQRIKSAYQTTKRELVGFSMGLLVIVLLFERIPVAIIGTSVSSNLKTVTAIIIGIVVLQVLFEIYERLEKSLSELPVIAANDLLNRIKALVEKDKKITIDLIGIAGRNGWQKVISYLLDDTDDEYSILEKREIHIRVAIVSDSALERIGEGGRIYSQVHAIAESIDATQQRLRKAGYDNIKIELYRYDHLPTILGLLINDNYLFLGHTYWQSDPDANLKLRGGGQQYIAYDKNDMFGGKFFIERFQGWFAYCTSQPTNRLAQNGRNDLNSEYLD